MLQVIDGGKSSDVVVLPPRALHFEKSKQIVRQQIMDGIQANADVPSWQTAIRRAWPSLKNIGRKSPLKASTIDEWLAQYPLPNTPENQLLSSGEIRLPLDANEIRQYEAVMREEWDWLISDILRFLRWNTAAHFENAKITLAERGKKINQLNLLAPADLKKYCRAAIKETLAASVSDIANRYKRSGWQNIKIHDPVACIAAHHCGPLVTDAKPTEILIGGAKIQFGLPIGDNDFAIFTEVMAGYYQAYGKWQGRPAVLYQRAIKRGLLPPPIRSYESRIRELEALFAADQNLQLIRNSQQNWHDSYNK
ncbi:hypothetical protein KBB08_02640 [Candidatus Gracilibacteria bacterium]|nr:hypothetical protein [Candidatus Gracilibacteria bacterium]